MAQQPVGPLLSQSEERLKTGLGTAPG